ncbi:MAG: HAMP domain-containing sensor histidine kinase [Salibacteraceae bacterium]
MTIRYRLTLQFAALAGIIMAFAMLVVYGLSENYRKEEFYDRLAKRSVNIAQILIEVDEIDEFLLYRIEQNSPVRLPHEAIRIYNYKNEMIFIMDEEGVIEPDTALFNRIRLDSLVRFSKGEREYLGLLFTSRFDRFVVIASAIDVYGLSKMKNLRHVLIVVYLCSFLLMILTGRLFASRALMPLKQLNREVEQVTPENLMARIVVNGEDEIAQLAMAFNSMLDRVEAAFAAQKNFIANASHELRTPLTAISGQLEVLLMNKRTVEEYETSLQSLLSDIHAMNRLANRLLLLAQTETDSQTKSFVAVRLDEVVWQCVEELQKVRKAYRVSVHFDESLCSDEGLTVIGSELLLKSAIYNLLENGCKYSDDNAVSLKLLDGTDELILEVSDNGIGIPESDLEKIFEPFYRGSNVGNRPGHGIGLSLVKRIALLHGGSLRIESSPGSGATVWLHIPRPAAG